MPDGKDNDCDDLVDEGTLGYDDDGDGFTELDGDCDDDDESINPDAEDVPDNGIDEDCDGEDETVPEIQDSDPPDDRDPGNPDGGAKQGPCSCASGPVGAAGFLAVFGIALLRRRKD
ncbi:MAG: hypothetical protein GY913_32155 [Proteobacteria bacterium]|nr:hypothetical protein [Pseudomonadota bacterium]MCP4921575.1 hypothetical protein [Pseudomonadota bacterium]